MPLPHSFEEREFENGSRALLIDVPGSPIISSGIHFRWYPNMSNPTRQPMHVLEHMLSSHTADERYKGVNIYDELQKNGGYTNAVTTNTGVTYINSSATDDWERMFGIQKTCIESPLFTEDLLRSEKGNVSEELKRNLTNYQRMANSLALTALVGMAQTDEKALESAANVSLDDVEELYAHSHVTSNMTYLVVGDIDGRLPMIDAALSKSTLPRGDLVRARSIESNQDGYSYVLKDGLKGVNVTVDFTANRDLGLKERTALKCISRMLFTTHSSRILGRARRQGVLYQMSADTTTDVTSPVVYNVNFPVGNQNLETVMTIFTEELREFLARGVGPDELEAVKRFRLGNFKRSGLSPTDLYDLYETGYFDRNNYIAPEELENAYAELGVKDIADVAHAVFGSGYWSLSGVGGVDEEVFRHLYDTMKNEVNGWSS